MGFFLRSLCFQAGKNVLPEKHSCSPLLAAKVLDCLLTGRIERIFFFQQLVDCYWELFTHLWKHGQKENLHKSVFYFCSRITYRDVPSFVNIRQTSNEHRTRWFRRSSCLELSTLVINHIPHSESACGHSDELIDISWPTEPNARMQPCKNVKHSFCFGVLSGSWRVNFTKIRRCYRRVYNCHFSFLRISRVFSGSLR